MLDKCKDCAATLCTGECVNLTDEELCEVMGFSMEDVVLIKEGEKMRS